MYRCIVCLEERSQGFHYQKHPTKPETGFVCRWCKERNKRLERERKAMATESGMVAVKVALRGDPELLHAVGLAIHKDAKGNPREVEGRLRDLRRGLNAVFAEESMLAKLDKVADKIKAAREEAITKASEAEAEKLRDMLPNKEGE